MKRKLIQTNICRKILFYFIPFTYFNELFHIYIYIYIYSSFTYILKFLQKKIKQFVFFLFSELQCDNLNLIARWWF
ncbi:hypothetical protein ACMBCM_06640, partial [Spiroplasma sp. K1]